VNKLFEAANEVCGFMEAQKWKYCIIGGLAVIRWGEIRATLDVDLNLLTGFGDEEKYAKTLLANFRGRVENALDFALKNRVLLIKASNGKDVDVSFGAFAFEEEMIARSTRFEFARGVFLRTCSAEDLFIFKALAGRGKDWSDAEAIAIRQKLDRRHISARLKPLCDIKNEPELFEKAMQVLKRK
jgi:hypothetical protein